MQVWILIDLLIYGCSWDVYIDGYGGLMGMVGHHNGGGGTTPSLAQGIHNGGEETTPLLVQGIQH